ncbi:hypothetical protein L1N85_22580 [Paenibacillus alkaliterrae]|uniref:hypothetical protein n=1 Tax=Paenibacillus alkaliterrae TaxID=320909 RepID=UPI001F1C4181|nr:hypothetical protein [Paenibacillus alkaliterrae]MCF2941161.1 hypothetical protein [Paenibacillus alkaliterrae]
MSAVNMISPTAQMEGIRTWRVGSLSMGVMLILMGTALAVSIWQDIEAYEMLMWVAPVVFIMLGAELLLYLKFSNSERAIVRYDWISVFFVGAVGLASLGLAFLMSTGLFDELQRGLNMTQRSAFVDTKTVQVPAEVNKIIVHSMGGVEFGETDTREVQLFGQVRYWSAEELERLDDRMMDTKIAGTTMYVMIGTVERRDGGFVSDTVDPQLTLIVPKGVEVVSRGL